jgi:hypothetical protein
MSPSTVSRRRSKFSQYDTCVSMVSLRKASKQNLARHVKSNEERVVEIAEYPERREKKIDGVVDSNKFDMGPSGVVSGRRSYI